MPTPALLAACAGLVAAGWYFPSPLFIDDVVDEAFIFPSEADVAAMDNTERDTAMAKAMQVASAMPDKAMSDSLPAATPTVLASGSFRDADSAHQGSGCATLYALPDGQHLVRFEGFRVTNGPSWLSILRFTPT